METTKRFTVVDTRTNQVKTFNSTATTVGELKQDLLNIGINPEGMAIQEGLTKTELSGDESLLPSDVNYRGTVTNNLVFRLTQPNKKIKSGNYTRMEIYNKIKDLSLADVIKAKYGNNYTNVKTSDLVKEVTEAMNDLKEPHKDSTLEDALVTLVNILYNADIITAYEANTVAGPLTGVKLFEDSCDCKDSDDFDYDIEDLFKNM